MAETNLTCYHCEPKEPTDSDLSDSCMGDKTVQKCVNGTDRCADLTSVTTIVMQNSSSITFKMSMRRCADPNFWALKPPVFTITKDPKCTEFDVPTGNVNVTTKERLYF